MPQSLPFALVYIVILAFIVTAVVALIPMKPTTQVLIKVLFGVLALLVLLQLIIIGEL